MQQPSLIRHRLISRIYHPLTRLDDACSVYLISYSIINEMENPFRLQLALGFFLSRSNLLIPDYHSFSVDDSSHSIRTNRLNVNYSPVIIFYYLRIGVAINL